MTKEELRTRIEAELLSGATPKDLAEKYDVKYVTIVNWRKALEQEKTSEKISELTNHTVASLEVIREAAKETAPSAAKKIDKIVDGLVGLKELEPEFHSAMHKAVSIAHEFLNRDDISVKEWQTITSTLANAYQVLFNKSGNVINVAQTNVSASSENLAFFKASKRSI